MEALKKIVKANESFTVNRYDNGFMIELDGYDKLDDWVKCKLVVNDIKDLHDIIDLINQIPKED